MNMKCEEVRINLPEYIDGKLDERTSEAVQGHLESCNSCRELYTELNSFLNFTDSFPNIEPPGGMKEEFMEMASLEEMPTGRKIRLIPTWVKVAAMIVVVCGTYLAGYQSGSTRNEQQNQQLASELTKQKQEVMLASLRDYSSPQKIEAVYGISNSGQASNELINALVHTMNSDKNVNVRLAAIAALSGMMKKSDQVKTELIKSLAVQKNPLLQISLIQVLTESGVKEAKDEIESITKDKNTDENVKAYAKDMIKTII